MTRLPPCPLPWPYADEAAWRTFHALVETSTDPAARYWLEIARREIARAGRCQGEPPAQPIKHPVVPVSDLRFIHAAPKSAIRAKARASRAKNKAERGGAPLPSSWVIDADAG